MFDQIGRVLENAGYRRVIVNIAGVGLYLQERIEQVCAVTVLDCGAGDAFTREQYENIQDQIRAMVRQGSGKPVVTLGILISSSVDAARGIYSQREYSWIVDTLYRRLLVYDDFPPVYNEIRKSIEEMLYGSDYPYLEQPRNTPPCQPAPVRKRVKLFAFSPVNTTIIVCNVAIFLLFTLDPSSRKTQRIFEWGALYWPAVFLGNQYWRLVTYMFLHQGFSHIFNNMLVLAFLGDNLERALGKFKYLILYFGSGILAGLTSLVWTYQQGRYTFGVGASGSIFGVIGALIFVLASNRGRLEDLGIFRLLFFAFLTLYSGFTSQGVDNAAHVGGVIAGFLLAALLYRRKKSSRQEAESTWMR